MVRTSRCQCGGNLPRLYQIGEPIVNLALEIRTRKAWDYIGPTPPATKAPETGPTRKDIVGKKLELHSHMRVSIPTIPLTSKSSIPTLPVEAVQRAVEFLAPGNVTLITGAGVSVDSGIRAYRGHDGRYMNPNYKYSKHTCCVAAFCSLVFAGLSFITNWSMRRRRGSLSGA